MKISLSTIKFLVRSHTREIKFFLLFIVFFFACNTTYYVFRDRVKPLVVDTLHVAVGSKIINILTPEEKTYVEKDTIRSSVVTLTIERGCEGVEGFLLIAAAICAFYAGIRQKIIGIILGFIIMYSANLTRIIGIYYTLKYKPALFDVMHVYVGQTYVIFIGLIFFIVWTVTLTQPHEKTN